MLGYGNKSISSDAETIHGCWMIILHVKMIEFCLCVFCGSVSVHCYWGPATSNTYLCQHVCIYVYEHYKHRCRDICSSRYSYSFRCAC